VKLQEIAERISAHLARFEADKNINAPRAHENNRGQVSRLPPYYHASAYASGRYVGIRYVSYQGVTHVSKDDAARYLRMLDDGYVGTHFEALRDGPPA
jgi:hypothetical protein